jgi:hypothetical protein
MYDNRGESQAMFRDIARQMFEYADAGGNIDEVP